MRILFLIDSLNGGGKERRLVQLIKGLNEKGFNDLYLISLSENNDYPVVNSYNVQLITLKRKVKKDPGMFFTLYKELKRIKPDIVHSWSLMTAFYVSVICKILTIKHISGLVADCNPVKKYSFYHGALMFPYKFADVIVGNSLAGLDAYQVPGKKKKVIYNGFQMNRLNVSKDPAALKIELDIHTRFVVVMAARFDVMKDYATFFTAAKKIISTRKDISFLAIGKGDQFEEFERNIGEQEKPYIKMPGFRSDIDAIAKMCDIGVLCTDPAFHAEGISNSLLEFMAFGKAVIATEGGGTSELITNNETGFIIDPKNPDQLVATINSLVDNPGLLTTIGANAKQSISANFSLEKMTDIYIDLYKKTCNA